ncbi:hypothetical protein KAM364_40850 [Aeromonas caviae]|nr:hypothetical protein KAM364_40850 [Aeromonas caviae]
MTDLELCQRRHGDGNQSEKHGENGGNYELFHDFISLGWLMMEALLIKSVA